jgi:hypothetical protein
MGVVCDVDKAPELGNFVVAPDQEIILPSQGEPVLSSVGANSFTPVPVSRAP